MCGPPAQAKAIQHGGEQWTSGRLPFGVVFHRVLNALNDVQIILPIKNGSNTNAIRPR